MSSQIRLVLAIHNHQPIGNFESVCEQSFRDSYAPFLDVLEDYPELPISLHTSGQPVGMAGRGPSRIHRPRADVCGARAGGDSGRAVLRADLVLAFPAGTAWGRSWPIPAT